MGRRFLGNITPSVQKALHQLQVVNIAFYKPGIMMTPTPDISLWEAALLEKYRHRELQRQRILATAIEALKKYFSRKRVRKVYLTGSILQEGKYYTFSDLDIAVEGLEEDYFVTLVELEELLDINVDLIELESCRFRREIQERGLEIQ
jgi:predicted nucleotidyltransferase